VPRYDLHKAFGDTYLLIADASQQQLIIIVNGGHCRLERSWCISSFFPRLAIRVCFYGQAHDKEYMTNVYARSFKAKIRGERKEKSPDLQESCIISTMYGV
jgi:hypothetical protein